ncbi:unnamed protein product [Phytophthora fragariaefolia]|uniref:Unnamed protein product n=1 Tax=Phytophthora fragariaefolia TaxID=1490495 RepID=A0A9W6X027_9STRA|nr:unnamed protein product [Phytophthora fragariaefolia]
MTYYCSQYDQSADDRYYTAKRDDDEHICDYLLRLNGYARSAKIMYETGGPVGARHVKRFLDKCEDDALVRQLIPQRFVNIAKVEAVINDTMASDRRPDREDRRRDSRGRREDRYSRQVTVAEASVNELYVAWQSRLAITPGCRAVSDSGSDYSDPSCKPECESDGDYVGTAKTGRDNIGGRADGQNRPHGFMGDGRRDEARRLRWGAKIAVHGQNMDHARPVVTRVIPCTGASADASSAHKYTEMVSASTTSSMRTRSSSSSQTTTRTPSHPNSKAEWHEDINTKDFGCEQDGGSCPVEESTILKSSEEVGELTGMITSAAFRERRTSARVETRRLIKGERRGLWSAKQFDRRKRMRALAMGAVNDWRTKILLDTGANISAVSESFARKL